MRWLLVDIQADSENGQGKPCCLVQAKTPAPAPKTPVRVIETADELRVDTGVLVAVFARKGGRFLRRLLVSGQDALAAGGAVEAYMNLAPRDTTQKSFTALTSASPDLQTALDEAGPLRVVARVRGAYGGPAGEPLNECALRFAFHAGRADVAVEHTFVWKEDPKQYTINGFGLRLPLRGVTAALAPCAAAGEAAKSALPWSVRQVDDKTHLLGAEKREGRWPGWACAVGQPASASFFVHDFWQQHPAGLRVDEAGVDLQFWPAEAPPLDLGVAKDEYAYFGATAVGVAKTHRVSLRFHAQPPAPQELATWARRAAEPLLLAAEPSAVLASNALWRLHPYDPKNFAGDEKGLENLFLGIERQPADTGVYGCMNWGDLHSRWDREKKQWSNYRYWLNNETTGDCTTISMWLQYVRTADRRYFRFPEARTSHLMDVDTCHYSVNQPPRFDAVYPADDVNIVGAQHRHAGQHWTGSTVLHHTVYDDILMYYHLTGRERALDVMREAALSMLGYVPRGQLCGRGDFRQMSSPFRLMGDLYWQFWAYDHWRMAAELHDRMMSYGYPDHRGEYGYVRYALFTGDKRYAAEWLARRVARGAGHQTALEFGRDDDGMAAGGAGSVMMDALKYQITGDRATLARILEARVHGGKLAYIAAWPLLKNYPDDAAKGNPPGYGWGLMGAFKFAYGMDALLRADLLAQRKLDAPAQTNGKGGGKWSDNATFKDGVRPAAESELTIAAGDTLVFDGDMTEHGLAGVVVEKGATLTFAPGSHTLIVRGDVTVK
ncbi:MAG TPA: hypothetical protein P5137_15705, partial [Candidatus Brocadiia bacterium]|nr:hypothetical protein [Candidatus Brocadiia bacterium]